MIYIVYLHIIYFLISNNMKIIHVHLIFEKKDYYFGSIPAIYSVLSEDVIGIKQSTLAHAGLAASGVKMTRRAIIRQSELIRSAKK